MHAGFSFLNSGFDLLILYTCSMINIEEQKTKLLDEQLALTKDLDIIGTKTKDGSWMVVPDSDDGTHADPIDNADTTEDYEEKIARLNVLEQRYLQVQKALHAIENNSYGICEISGEKIPEDRLRANPSATTLVEHAQ